MSFHPHAAQILPDAASVAEAAVEELIAVAERALADKRLCHVALSGGSTPGAMYALLRERSDLAEVLSACRFYWGDERSVPNDHPDSNVYLAMEKFLRPLGIEKHSCFVLDGGAADLAAEGRRYMSVIEKNLPRNGANIPQFDLIFLGMGTDGHTASLFPGTKALAETRAAVVENNVPQLSTKRLTFTFPLLSAAKEALILCTGANKAEKVAEIFNRRNEPAVYPVEFVHAASTRWLVDREAASKLIHPG